jgi:hypothetical protein
VVVVLVRWLCFEPLVLVASQNQSLWRRAGGGRDEGRDGEDVAVDGVGRCGWWSDAALGAVGGIIAPPSYVLFPFISPFNVWTTLPEVTSQRKRHASEEPDKICVPSKVKRNDDTAGSNVLYYTHTYVYVQHRTVCVSCVCIHT